MLTGRGSFRRQPDTSRAWGNTFTARIQGKPAHPGLKEAAGPPPSPDCGSGGPATVDGPSPDAEPDQAEPWAAHGDRTRERAPPLFPARPRTPRAPAAGSNGKTCSPATAATTLTGSRETHGVLHHRRRSAPSHKAPRSARACAEGSAPAPGCSGSARRGCRLML